MAHPQKDSKKRPTYSEAHKTNESYGREASRMARSPNQDQDFLAMEHPVGVPRDARGAWPSYDQVMPHSTLSHREHWSKYSQPIDSHPRAPHPSIQSSAEMSNVVSPTHGKSKRRHKDDAHSLEPSAWNVTPERRKPVKSEHRRGSRSTHSDPGVGVSPSGRGHTRRMHNSPIFPSIKEDNESRHQLSHADNHKAIPPMAPKIPRLPTPDFSDDEESRPFCPCCNADGGHEVGCELEESTEAKMERQLYEAKVYMARQNPRAH
ncbi:hypothetical protein F4781DRAFT_206362 [Annulohypoxylon bovei var. microspora]|nr:hypothetical protein F4781DRAFT_206362 [Annulohypoxylon bovei var. microspora]